MFSRRGFLSSAVCAIVFVLFALASNPAFCVTADPTAIDKEIAVYRGQFTKLEEDFKKAGGTEEVVNQYKQQLEQNVETAKSSSTTTEESGDKVATAEESAAEDNKRKYTPEEIAKLEEEARAAKEREQSGANKMLGGLSMAAAGIGGMQLMQGMAEKKADEDAKADMEAYMSTIKCGHGGAKNIPYNESGHTPEESRQLADARLKYTVLATKLKSAKESLDMQPGIESELIIDTTNGLYDNSGTDTGGIQHHFDTATERADSGSGQKRMIAGGVAAGAGVIGGVVGNAAINGEKKDAGSGGGGGGIGGMLSGAGGMAGKFGGVSGAAGVLGKITGGGGIGSILSGGK